MGRKYTDNALTALAGALAIGGTTLTVLTGKGDNFPAITGRGAAGAALDYFVITMEDAAGNREKIRVEERTAASDVLGSAGYPLSRGYDGTAPMAWAAGDLVDLRIERKGIQEELTDLVAADAPARLFGLKASTSSGLNFGYYGGQMWVDGVLTTIADGLIALTLSATNFVEHDRAGVVSTNTVGFSASKYPIAEISTNATVITSFTDRRISNRPQVGRLVKSVAGGAGNTILTAAEVRNDILEFTGALTGNRTIEVPAIARVWIVLNNTTGAFSLTVKTAAGQGLAVTQGKRAILTCDGVDVLSALSDFASVGGFPAGTRMLFQQTNAPTGWTKEASATYNDAALRIVTGSASTGGASGFSTVFAAGRTTNNDGNGTTTAYALTIADIPSHSHQQKSRGSIGVRDTAAGGSSLTSIDVTVLADQADNGPLTTEATGGGGSHTHATPSHIHGLPTFNVKFADCIIAQKD